MAASIEVVQTVLDRVPVPYLGKAFSMFRLIWSQIQAIRGYKKQMKHLTELIAQLLHNLNDKIGPVLDLEISTRNALDGLNQLLDDIHKSVEVHISYSFLKFMWMKHDIQAMIDDFYRKIADTITSFQLHALIDIQHVQKQGEHARHEDTKLLHAEIHAVKENQDKLVEMLNEAHSKDLNPTTTAAALETRLTYHQDNSLDRLFFENSLNCLKQLDPTPMFLNSNEFDSSGAFVHHPKSTFPYNSNSASDGSYGPQRQHGSGWTGQQDGRQYVQQAGHFFGPFVQEPAAMSVAENNEHRASPFDHRHHFHGHPSTGSESMHQPHVPAAVVSGAWNWKAYPENSAQAPISFPMPTFTPNPRATWV